MNLVSRIVAGLGGERASLTNPSDALRSTFLGDTSYSGKNVSVDTALTLIPVFAASSMVAGAIGGVPLKVYNSSREEARSSRQWAMLHDEPNDEMSADELWELVAHHLLLWGNSFLLKERDSFGIVQKLWPIRPSRLTVGRDPARAGRQRRYFQIDGLAQKYYETDILQIRGLSSDGLIGYSVIQQGRQALGNMLAQDEFSGRFWSNGTFQGAALLHPGEMSAPAQERLAKQIARKKGVAEAGGIWVFEEDMKIQTLGMPLRDAQFIEQSKLSKQAIAEMFGLVPPYRWGSENSQLTYANAEAAGTEFVRWTGRRWWKRIEKSLQRDKGLFPAFGPSLSCEFLTEDLDRGETKTRYEGYKIAISAHMMTPNEARAKENLPPIEGGDEFPPVGPAVPAASDTPSPARTVVVNVPPDERRSAEAIEQLAMAVDHWADAEERETVIQQPDVNVVVNVPESQPPAITVDVHPTPVTVDAPVTVNVPVPAETEVRVVEVHPTPVTVEAPVTVNVPPPGDRKVRFDRDINGNIKSAEIEDQ